MRLTGRKPATAFLCANGHAHQARHVDSPGANLDRRGETVRARQRVTLRLARGVLDAPSAQHRNETGPRAIAAGGECSSRLPTPGRRQDRRTTETRDSHRSGWRGLCRPSDRPSIDPSEREPRGGPSRSSNSVRYKSVRGASGPIRIRPTRWRRKGHPPQPACRTTNRQPCGHDACAGRERTRSCRTRRPPIGDRSRAQSEPQPGKSPSL